MDPKKFLKKITCEYDAKVPLHNPDILNYFTSRKAAVEYFRKYPEYFAIFEDDEGNPQMVGARLKDVRLCIGYCVRRRGYRCFDPDCPDFHLCRDFVGGYCNNGLNCDMCHSLNTDSNKKILRRLGLLDTYPPYPEEKLLALLRMSLPQVCGWYNRDLGCPNDSACTRFHLCKHNIIRVCNTPKCGKAHDLSSAHTKRLLKIYNLEGKTLEEIKDSFIIHKVMPKSDEDVSRLQMANFLDKLRWKPTDSTVDAETAAADELAMNQEEILQIQKALGDTDFAEIFINQQLVESQVELLTEKREGLPETQNVEEAKKLVSVTRGRDIAGALSSLFMERAKPVEAEVYLCEAFVNGQCSQENCKDVHFQGRFLWQVQIRGEWYDMHSVNDELEQAYNRREKDYTTQVPLESKHEPGELLLIKFRPVIKGRILHNKESADIRRLQVRPVTHPPTHLLNPTAISGKQEDTKEKTVVQASVSTDKPEIKKAPKGRVCWQICMEEEWIPLADANDEIENAYQRKEDEYLTEVLWHEDIILIAINFKNNNAISLSDATEFEVRRQVNDDEAAETTDTILSSDIDTEIDIEDESASDAEVTAQTSEWQWQWRNNQLEWIPYDEAISAVLEERYAKGKQTCRMKVDGEMWIVDYLAETQENRDTAEIRHIRRVNK